MSKIITHVLIATGVALLTFALVGYITNGPVFASIAAVGAAFLSAGCLRLMDQT